MQSQDIISATERQLQHKTGVAMTDNTTRQ